MKAALYVRVSTTDRGQSVEVQEGPLNEWLDRLGGYDARITYSEEGVSGARSSRPQLDKLVRAVRRREVDAVAVWKLDRLGRSLEHLLQLLREFEANQVRLLVHDMAIDTGTPQGRLFFQMAGAFAEFERALIGERTRDGLAYARSHGTKSGRPIGRPRRNVDLAALRDAVTEMAGMAGGRQGSIAGIARRFGVSRSYVYRNVLPALQARLSQNPLP